MWNSDRTASREAGEKLEQTMTEEQKFLFDVKGWPLIPAVLSASEIRAVKEHLLTGGNSFTGPAQELLDHPVVADILNEILSESSPQEDIHNFRCEDSFVTLRQNGWKPGATDVPHVVRPPQGAGPMNYQCNGGRIYSALTRVVWELNPVKKETAELCFCPVRTRRNFPIPDSVRVPDNEHLEAYACPAGSVFIFTSRCCTRQPPGRIRTWIGSRSSTATTRSGRNGIV